MTINRLSWTVKAGPQSIVLTADATAEAIIEVDKRSDCLPSWHAGVEYLQKGAGR